MTTPVSVRFSDADLARFDAVRGHLSRSDFVRLLVPSPNDGPMVPAIGRTVRERAKATPDAVAFNLDSRILTTSSGDHLIDTDRHRGDEFIGPRRPGPLLSRLGVTMLTGVTGSKQSFPRIDSTTNLIGAWRDEDESAAVADPALDEVSLPDPVELQLAVQVTRNLLYNGSPHVEMLLADEFRRALLDTIANAAITGAGTSQTASDEPTGLLNQGLPLLTRTNDTDGAAWTWAQAVAMCQTLTTKGVEPGAWAVSPKTARKAKTVERAAGSGFIMDGGMIDGIPAVEHAHIPDAGVKGSGSGLGAAILGDWSDLVVAVWAGTESGEAGRSMDADPVSGNTPYYMMDPHPAVGGRPFLNWPSHGAGPAKDYATDDGVEVIVNPYGTGSTSLQTAREVIISATIRVSVMVRRLGSFVALVDVDNG